MICKYCGNRLSGHVCPSCNKVASLSYTSHELSDMLGKRIIGDPAPNEEQLKSAYNNGFAEGQKRGFAKGYDSAQRESAEAVKRQQRFFIVVAASGALILALLSSIVTGIISSNSRYRNGVLFGQQEQRIADESDIAEARQQGYEAGKEQGYSDGYQAGYDQGLLVTPTPEPTATLTPKPTQPQSLLLLLSRLY